MQQQSRALSVVLHSHLRSAFATARVTMNVIDAKLAWGLLSEQRRPAEGVPAESACAEAVPTEQQPDEPTTEDLAALGASRSRAAAPRRAGYALRLGAAYALTPLLALAAGQGLMQRVASAEIAVMAGSLWLLLPPSIHLIHGATERAWRAFVFMVACTALISVGGAAIGYAIGKASCDPSLNGECGLTALAWVLVGGAVGGLLGYSAHARRDVVLHSSAPARPT